MDGGQTWVRIGKTSLIKYMPLKRVQGRLQPPTMPDHIDLSFTAEVSALTLPPPESDPAPARAPAPVFTPSPAPAQPTRAPARAVQPWWLVPGAVGVGCLLVGFMMGRWTARPAAVTPEGNQSKIVEPPSAPMIQMAEVDRSRSGQMVTVVGTLGVVEERAESAQLPGFQTRRVLVRIHHQGASLLVAVPWREDADAKPGTLFVPMSDAGAIVNPRLAKLTDAAGVSVEPGARIRVTGKVRFKISDVPMVYPILEATEVKVAGPLE